MTTGPASPGSPCAPRRAAFSRGWTRRGPGRRAPRRSLTRSGDRARLPLPWACARLVPPWRPCRTRTRRFCPGPPACRPVPRRGGPCLYGPPRSAAGCSARTGGDDGRKARPPRPPGGGGFALPPRCGPLPAPCRRRSRGRCVLPPTTADGPFASALAGGRRRCSLMLFGTAGGRRTFA